MVPRFSILSCPHESATTQIDLLLRAGFGAATLGLRLRLCKRCVSEAGCTPSKAQLRRTGFSWAAGAHVRIDSGDGRAADAYDRIEQAARWNVISRKAPD